MTATKTILGLAPLVQSAMILEENVKLLNKKKKQPKDFIGTGIKTIIGAEFIKAESDLIAGMV